MKSEAKRTTSTLMAMKSTREDRRMTKRISTISNRLRELPSRRMPSRTMPVLLEVRASTSLQRT